jgi:hemolysin activation/secretion protein
MTPRHLLPAFLAAFFFALPLRAAEPAAETAAAAAADRFAVLEFRVLGNSVLDARAIERAVYPHAGPDKTIADIEQARLALETTYRDRGFGTVYVDIPEQTVDSGIVRLKVTEGRLRRVSVEGAKYVSGRRLVARLPAAEPGRAPELPALQTQLALLNAETRDRVVTPILGAGPVPGTVDLRLQVADELPLHASLEINDRFTADTERLRLTAAVSYDNLFDRLHSIGVQYQTAPQEPDQVGVLAASYTARLGENADRLAFTYISSDTNVAALGTLAVLGKGQIYQMRWTRTLANTAASTHSLTAGFDYKDFEENIRLDEDDSFTTPISYTNATLAYSGVWRAEKSLWQLGSSVGFGPRPFNGEQ